MLNPRQMTKQKSLDKALKIMDLNKQISERKRKVKELRILLMENGVSRQALNGASLPWMEQKADELGVLDQIGG